MDQQQVASPGIRLRPAGLARLFLIVCVLGCVWIAVGPIQHYADTRARAEQTRTELRALQAREAQLAERAKELGRGSGLEEQARRQGLISPSEKAYVVEDLPSR